jgi:pyroglutamyl-peptidase
MLPARRPARLLVCGFGDFPGFADNPASGVIERLRAAGWAPEAVETAYQPIPTTWAGAFEAAAGAARTFGAHGVLVLGVAGGADGFRVETQALNRACTDKPDAGGALQADGRISISGAAVARATAPAQAMVAALEHEGLPASISSNAGDYLCNYVFYRLLSECADLPSAFLHLPPGLDPSELDRGAKAVATVFGRTLASASPEPVAAAGR